eukprot:jgi/Tetstr1/447341/TSEL_034778.t1
MATPYLPRECAYRIFSFLSDDELDVTKQVSRGFYQASSALRTMVDLFTERRDIFQRDEIVGKTEHAELTLTRFRGGPASGHRPIPGYPNRYVSRVLLTGPARDLYARDLTYLRALEVDPFVYKSVSLPGLDVVLRHCSFLETLVAPRVRLTNEAVRALKGATSLKRLGLMDAKVDPTDAVEFPQSLTDLDTSFCRLPRHNLPGLANLKRLNAMDMLLSPAEIGDLFALTNLEFLDVSWNPADPGGGTFLRRVGTLRNLEHFAAAMMGNLGREGHLSYLATLSNLTHLTLENCDIRSEHLVWMRGATSTASLALTHVNLSYNYIDSVGVEHICANLPRVELLDLSYNEVCDAGANTIRAARMPRLKHLDLMYNMITSAGALILAEMGPSLEYLDLTRNINHMYI